MIFVFPIVLVCLISMAEKTTLNAKVSSYLAAAEAADRLSTFSPAAPASSPQLPWTPMKACEGSKMHGSQRRRVWQRQPVLQRHQAPGEAGPRTPEWPALATNPFSGEWKPHSHWTSRIHRVILGLCPPSPTGFMCFLGRNRASTFQESLTSSSPPLSGAVLTLCRLHAIMPGHGTISVDASRSGICHLPLGAKTRPSPLEGDG